MKLSKFMKLTALVISTSLAKAGGIETNPLSSSHLYEKGHSIEISQSFRNYNVTGTIYSPSASAFKKQNFTAIAGKLNLGSQLSLGASYYHQAGVQIDYSGGGSPYASILPTVDLNIYALALLAKYQILANISLIGGTKYTLIKDASADIFKSIPIAQSEIKEAGEFGTVLGVAYEKPEIALRVELLYEAQTKFSLETDNADLGSGKSIGSVPNYFTLNLQSGVYKDTLAFASFHHANWSENQLRVHPQIEDTSSFIDSLTYSLGLAYKISEKISIYSNFSGEEAKDSDSTSLLSITDGYYGFSFGGRYLINHLSIGLGVNQTYLGDVDLSLTGLPIGEFKDNTITSYGVKLAYNFN